METLAPVKKSHCSVVFLLKLGIILFLTRTIQAQDSTLVPVDSLSDVTTTTNDTIPASDPFAGLISILDSALVTLDELQMENARQEELLNELQNNLQLDELKINELKKNEELQQRRLISMKNQLNATIGKQKKLNEYIRKIRPRASDLIFPTAGGVLGFYIYNGDTAEKVAVGAGTYAIFMTLEHFDYGGSYILSKLNPLKWF